MSKLQTEGFNRLHVEAALCIWEDMLAAYTEHGRSDNAKPMDDGQLAIFTSTWENHGSVEMRHAAIDLGASITEADDLLDRGAGHNGRFSWGSKRDELLDVERVFYVLEGEPLPSAGTIVNLIELDRSKNWSPMQSEIESRFMKIRIFKNGNAHLWFTNQELVEKVNKILADYYGEVIGDGNTTEADPFAEVKHLPARYFGFFPTPDDAADRVFDGRGSRSFNNGIIVFQPKDKPRLRVLEPSAGTGNLARRCVTIPANAGRYAREYRYDNLVDCVEIQPHLAAQLKAEGHYNRVLCMDFLQLNPESTSPYDLVVMNPPFDRERDIDHVMHAVKFLKPGGRLTAIMSAGTEFRETRKAIAFREFVASLGGEFVDLPAGSFSDVGTNVNTLYVTFRTKA